jgi:hypothetical protein
MEIHMEIQRAMGEEGGGVGNGTEGEIMMAVRFEPQTGKTCSQRDLTKKEGT